VKVVFVFGFVLLIMSRAMNALKLALEARQAQANSLKAETGQNWVRRADVEAKKREEYLDDLRREQEKAKVEEELRTKILTEHLTRKQSKAPVEKVVSPSLIDLALLADDDAEPPLALEEVIERLREVGQPITLFGETDMQRFKRMRHLEKEAHVGRKNPDLVLLEQLHEGQKERASGAVLPVADGQAEEDEEDVEMEAPVVDEGDKSDTEDEREEVTQQRLEGDVEPPAEKSADLPHVEIDMKLMDTCDFIRSWIRKTVKAWEKELADKSEEEKLKAVVKVELAQHRQTRREVKPLQKRLRVYVLNEWMLNKIHTIVKYADDREYRSAAEAYIDLSVGKAAWPVGIGCGGSMLMEDAIGLHDRFNRNDQVKDVAFALNDDVARKYVQALKRLMSVAQRYWPAADPSKGTV